MRLSTSGQKSLKSGHLTLALSYSVSTTKKVMNGMVIFEFLSRKSVYMKAI